MAESRHRLLDEDLGPRIDVARRLVEDKNTRVREERPCDREQLFLAG